MEGPAPTVQAPASISAASTGPASITVPELLPLELPELLPLELPELPPLELPELLPLELPELLPLELPELLPLELPELPPLELPELLPLELPELLPLELPLLLPLELPPLLEPAAPELLPVIDASPSDVEASGLPLLDELEPPQAGARSAMGATISKTLVAMVVISTLLGRLGGRAQAASPSWSVSCRRAKCGQSGLGGPQMSGPSVAAHRS